MSDAFVSSPAKAFSQSQCRARVTRIGSPFRFQILNGIRRTDDDNFAPQGWPDGFPPGGYVPYVDWTPTDVRLSTFIVPTALQLKNDGWLHETWLSSVQLTDPPTPFLGRLGTGDHPKLHRSGTSYYTAETSPTPHPNRKGIVVWKQGSKYTDVTNDRGRFFKGGILYDQIQRLKLYNTLRGTITKHHIASNIDGSQLFNQLPTFTTSLPNPTHTEGYEPAAGDLPKTFEPDEFVYSVGHHDPHFNNPYVIDTVGTIELLILWFNITPDDLPDFPYAFNSEDFFFVG